MLCAICGGVASGIHYGASSCEGCRAFFRRAIEDGKQYGNCLYENVCYIIHKNKGCQACRLKNCISAGMDPGLVGLGRYPKKTSERGSHNPKHDKKEETDSDSDDVMIQDIPTTVVNLVDSSDEDDKTLKKEDLKPPKPLGAIPRPKKHISSLFKQSPAKKKVQEKRLKLNIFAPGASEFLPMTVSEKQRLKKEQDDSDDSDDSI